MTKEEISELVAALPQGMDADEFIVKLVNWAVDIERDAIIKILEAYKNLDAFTAKQVSQATIEAIRARGIDLAKVGVWGHKWVGLTDEEKQWFKGCGLVGVDIIEAKLREKNGGSLAQPKQEPVA